MNVIPSSYMTPQTDSKRVQRLSDILLYHIPSTQRSPRTSHHNIPAWSSLLRALLNERLVKKRNVNCSSVNLVNKNSRLRV